jgi:WD40 repeat protein
LVYELKGHNECVWGVAFSPDGRRLATCSGSRTAKAPNAAGEIKLWDTASGLELVSLRGTGATIFDVSFSPDGRWFGAAGADGKIRVWDLMPKQGVVGTPQVVPALAGSQ